jgi:hypothetical protein
MPQQVLEDALDDALAVIADRQVPEPRPLLDDQEPRTLVPAETALNVKQRLKLDT